MSNDGSGSDDPTDMYASLLPQPPTKRAEAVRYISYRTLLATSRAVRRKKNYLFVSSAGDNPQIQRLACATKTEAKRLGSAMSLDLRQARSDGQYNKILLRILAEVQRVWPHQPELEHVHTCEMGKQCAVDTFGKTLCGFDWAEHQLTVDCACGPELDQTDAAGKYHFVVHKDMKGRAKIYL